MSPLSLSSWLSLPPPIVPEELNLQRDQRSLKKEKNEKQQPIWMTMVMSDDDL
jgi:hypothetical protein